MKKSSVILALAVILVALASFWAGGEYVWKKCESALNRPDTVYVEKWLPQPVEEPKDSTPQKPIYVYLRVPYPVHDTTAVHDTTTLRDSVLVEVPIVEKTYEGENYKATVRGFNPELVDMCVKERETMITVPYRKRWSITVGPQAGIGITPKGLQPYAGGGITFGYSF